MDIRQVDDDNLHVYLNLCQSYEGEFSSLTEKIPGADGLFTLDTVIGGDVAGYLLYEDSAPIGLAAIKMKAGGRYEVCEFYVVPCCRLRSLGKRFAMALFDLFPGRWEVKQIDGAEYATRFWQKVIGEYTDGNFHEDVYQDAYWGRVVRQQFCALSPEPGEQPSVPPVAS